MKNPCTRGLSLALLAAAAVCAPHPQGASPRADDEHGHALLERVVLGGASVTDGFGLLAEVGANIDLGDFLGAMLEPGHEPLASYGDSMFFRSPHERGEALIERVVAQRPTLVFAVDFLFWFGYGYQRGEERRLESLEYGLSLLERVECPLVIGDFPDVSRALHGQGPFGVPMIRAPMIPKAPTLDRLNARVNAWAAERGNVVVVSIADVLRRINAGESFEVRGNTFAAGAGGRLLQADLLHLTAEGTIGFLMLAVDALVREELAPAESFVWDADLVRERLWAATADERARNEEKDRRRAERRARRSISGETSKAAGGGG